MKTTCTWLMLAMALAGCASPPRHATMQQLQSRASFDLACPSSWMRVFHLDAVTKGVEGCGTRMTYVERCERDDGASCAWVLDMGHRPMSATPAFDAAWTPAPPHAPPAYAAPQGAAPAPAGPAARHPETHGAAAVSRPPAVIDPLADRN